jgi:cytoskeletal protein CcmA (bactofilin family)
MADASVIGQATVVRGNVRGDGSVEVHGRVEGDVSVAGDVTLFENAVVRGSITGARLTIGGTVSGDLTGSEAVALGSSAQVAGDISAPRVGIEEGAQLNGAVRTGGSTGNVGQSASRPAMEPRRAPPRAADVPRIETAKRASTPQMSASAAAPAAKRPPPEPVVPAIRRGLAKKKTRRQ